MCTRPQYNPTLNPVPHKPSVAGYTYKPSPPQAEAGKSEVAQGYPRLQAKFEAGPRYMRPSLKKGGREGSKDGERQKEEGREGERREREYKQESKVKRMKEN